MVASTSSPLSHFTRNIAFGKRLLDDAVELELVALRLFSLPSFTHQSVSFLCFSDLRGLRSTRLRHLGHVSDPVDPLRTSPCFLVVGQEHRGGRLLVRVEPLPNDVLLVVGPVLELGIRGAADYTSSGKSVQCVCRCAAGTARSISSSSGHVDARPRCRASCPRVVEERVERLGLRHRAREAVEQEAALGVVRLGRGARRPARSRPRPGRGRRVAMTSRPAPAGSVPFGLAPRAACRRSRSAGSPQLLAETLACVPLPAPGGPTKTSRITTSLRPRMRVARPPPPERPS